MRARKSLALLIHRLIRLRKFEQLRVQLTELALEFGQLTANILGPVVDFFNDNLVAALVLFGGILGLVFGRAIQAISGFAANSLMNFSKFSDGLADAALRSSKNFDIIKTGHKNYRKLLMIEEALLRVAVSLLKQVSKEMLLLELLKLEEDF